MAIAAKRSPGDGLPASSSRSGYDAVAMLHIFWKICSIRCVRSDDARIRWRVLGTSWRESEFGRVTRSSDESKRCGWRASADDLSCVGGGSETSFRISLATSLRASSTDTQEVIAFALRGMIWSSLKRDSSHRHGLSRTGTTFEPILRLDLATTESGED